MGGGAANNPPIHWKFTPNIRSVEQPSMVEDPSAGEEAPWSSCSKNLLTSGFAFPRKYGGFLK